MTMTMNSRIVTALALGAVAALVPVHAFVNPALAPRGATFVQPKQQHAVVAEPASFRKPLVLFMGWGPEPVWSSAEVKTSTAANKSGNSVSITVAVPPETAQGYEIPGQYVQVRLNDGTKPLFLAISSAPDKENASFEFLIKKTDDNGWMTDAGPGTNVEISQVLGGGFPMAEHLDGFKYDFPTQNILLFGVGSGIAPLKAAMESGT
jgi:hypothetical protein